MFGKPKSKMQKPKTGKKPLTATSASNVTNPSSDTAIFLNSLNDPDVIERLRVTIKNAHVFKLPTRQTVSVGWRGADWKEKVWQGTVKVVERGNITAILLEDATKNTIFAVCPIREGAVDRCIDSSRYFVLRIENSNGRHMFIGVAFNERNDAFDFNTALEDSRREREAELAQQKTTSNLQPSKDYRLKEGEKIRVAIPKIGNSLTRKDGNMGIGHGRGTEAFANFFGQGMDDSLDFDNSPEKEKDKKKESSVSERRKVARQLGGTSGGFLRPSSKDTPRRVPGGSTPTTPERKISDGFSSTFRVDENFFNSASSSSTAPTTKDPFFP